MNSTETIEYLGRSQGKYLTPYLDKSGLKKDIPFISITKSYVKNVWQVTEAGGYVGHDNEPRMQMICDYLNQTILPNVRSDVNISGFYNIELHDGYSYRNVDPKKYDNVIVFNKLKNHNRAICVPNPYQIQGYGDLFVKDQIPWEDKLNKIVGAYTTTGSTDPSKNVRVQTCLWSLNHRDVCDVYLTRIAQMSPEDLFDKYPQIKNTFADYIPFEEQTKYKFILSLPGNVSSWFESLTLYTKSLMIQKDQADINWYSPILLDGYHYSRYYENDEILKKMKYFLSNPAEAKYITFNANKFVSDFMYPPTHAQLYWTSLLEEMADNR
jgi:hypothetical protein